MSASPDTNLRRKIAALGLIVAPLVMLSGDLLRFAAGMHRAGFNTLKLSFALFVPAILGIVHLLRNRADHVGLVGGAMALIGCLAGAGIVTAAVYDLTLANAGFSEATSRAIGDARAGLQMNVVMYPLPGLLFPLGLLVLAAALHRTRVIAPWVAALFALGAVLFPVGRIWNFAWASLSSDIALVISMGITGLRVLGWTAEEWEKVPSYPVGDPLAGREATT